MGTDLGRDATWGMAVVVLGMGLGTTGMWGGDACGVSVCCQRLVRWFWYSKTMRQSTPNIKIEKSANATKISMAVPSLNRTLGGELKCFVVSNESKDGAEVEFVCIWYCFVLLYVKKMCCVV